MYYDHNKEPPKAQNSIGNCLGPYIRESLVLVVAAAVSAVAVASSGSKGKKAS